VPQGPTKLPRRCVSALQGRGTRTTVLTSDQRFRVAAAHTALAREASAPQTLRHGFTADNGIRAGNRISGPCLDLASRSWRAPSLPLRRPLYDGAFQKVTTSACELDVFKGATPSAPSSFENFIRDHPYASRTCAGRDRRGMAAVSRDIASRRPACGRDQRAAPVTAKRPLRLRPAFRRRTTFAVNAHCQRRWPTRHRAWERHFSGEACEARSSRRR